MAAKKAAPRKAAKPKPTPLLNLEEADAETPAEPQEKASAPTGFVWKPKDGSEPIVLPTDFEKPDKLWLWELYNEDFLTQSFAWLERAGTPKDVQRRAVSLPDEEYLEMLTSWFKFMGGATPGE